MDKPTILIGLTGCTAKNSNILTFVMNVFEPQTATAGSSSSSCSTTPTVVVVDKYYVAGVVS
jgi:hypothetical protein